MLDISPPHYPQEAETLERGDIFFMAGMDTEPLHEHVTSALVAYGKTDRTVQEKNIAINKTLTAFYGVPDIAQ